MALDLGLQGLFSEPMHDSAGVVATQGPESWPRELQGLRLVLRDELINVVLHELWRGGHFDLRVDQDFLEARKAEVALVAGFLGDALKGLPDPPDPETPMWVRLSPRLPPVATLDLPVSAGLRLGIGDLALEFWAEGGSAPLLSEHLSLRMDGQLRSVEDRLRIQVSTLDLALDLDTADPALAALEAGIEAGVRQVFAGLVPTLAGALADFPMPSAPGFTLANLMLGTQPECGGAIVLQADLVPTATGLPAPR
jgi:hypothetical protein